VTGQVMHPAPFSKLAHGSINPWVAWHQQSNTLSISFTASSAQLHGRNLRKGCGCCPSSTTLPATAQHKTCSTQGQRCLPVLPSFHAARYVGLLSHEICFASGLPAMLSKFTVLEPTCKTHHTSGLRGLYEGVS
jgi:hypothetical protein